MGKQGKKDSGNCHTDLEKSNDFSDCFFSAKLRSNFKIRVTFIEDGRSDDFSVRWGLFLVEPVLPLFAACFQFERHRDLVEAQVFSDLVFQV
jgi:hypothetical protein